VLKFSSVRCGFKSILFDCMNACICSCKNKTYVILMCCSFEMHMLHKVVLGFVSVLQAAITVIITGRNTTTNRDT
jgi:hypothetical protein